MIATKRIGIILPVSGLVPRIAGALLTSTESTGALGATKSHGRATVAGRRSALRAAKVVWLTAVLRSFKDQRVSQGREIRRDEPYSPLY